MTVITAVIIQTRDDIHTMGVLHTPTGLFMGWITLGPDENYRELITTEPFYKTEKEAVDTMNNVVAKVRAMTVEELLEASHEKH